VVLERNEERGRERVRRSSPSPGESIGRNAGRPDRNLPEFATVSPRREGR
jgi:hypothetical protein